MQMKLYNRLFKTHPKHKAMPPVKPNLNSIYQKYNPETSLSDKSKKIETKFLLNSLIKPVTVNYLEQLIDLTKTSKLKNTPGMLIKMKRTS